MTPRKRIQPGIHRQVRGFSLVELMVAIVVVALFMTGVFALFTNFLTQSGEQASRAKRGSDARMGLNLVKRDLTNTGFGIANDFMGTAIAGTGTTVTIRSTAVHDRARPAGQHGFVQDNGDVADGMGGVIDAGLRGIAMTPDRDRLMVTNRGNLDGSVGAGNLFFVGNQDGGEPYHYQRQYRLGGAGGGECEANTPDLQSNDTNGGTAGVVDCVLDLRFRYGFEVDSGNVQFTSDPNSPPATAADTTPDLLKVAMLLQVSRSPQDGASPATIAYTDNAFGGVTVNLTAGQQDFHWERLEWSIPLENLQ